MSISNTLFIMHLNRLKKTGIYVGTKNNTIIIYLDQL